LSDRAFAGSDTWATANAIGGAIKSLGNFDLLLFGRQAIDGDTAQVGPQTAEYLNIPQITYAQKIEIEGKKVKAERQMEDGYEVISCEMPCLITCISEINEIVYPTLKGIRQAYREKEVNLLNADEAKIDKSKVGLLSSPTSVKKSFTPPARGGGQVLSGTMKDNVAKIVKLLKDKELVS
jgi:electron transfer flavoprotein beta subunit